LGIPDEPEYYATWNGYHLRSMWTRAIEHLEEQQPENGDELQAAP